jgi:hypothetical protein
MKRAIQLARQRLLLLSIFLLIGAALLLYLRGPQFLTVYAQGGLPIVEEEIYPTYEFNLLKNPTGLLGLYLRNGGFRLFIADSGSHVIRMFDPASGTLTTVAGTVDTADYADGSPLSAQFKYPTGLTGKNYTWVECEYDYMAANAPQIGKIVLPPVRTDPLDGVLAPNLEMSSLPKPNPLPLGFTTYRTCYYHNYQDLHINDSQNYMIRRAVIGDVPDNQIEEVTTIAGSNVNGYTDGSPASAAFASLGGHTDSGDSCYILDSENNCIRVESGGTVSTFAGDGYPGFVDGYKSEARFSLPAGITKDDVGDIYVADMENHAIRKIDATGYVTTLAGTGDPGASDGQGSFASFDRPTSIVFNPADSVFYVADSDNNVIRRVDKFGNVTIYAGAPEGGMVDGYLTDARFDGPTDIVIRNGIMYVSDARNNMIRRIDMATGQVTTLIR